MAEKKLTKVQKEILTTLRDTIGARIVSVWRGSFQLRVKGERKRIIRDESFYFLKYWLQEVGYNGGDKFYAFKPGAEISDAWRLAEIERQRAEAQRRRDEDERRKEEEYQALVGRLKDTFAAIERGEIDNALVEYGYVARFQNGDKWYRITEED